ncbi:ATP-binding protein [Nonomuraea sp. NPDC047897]|uniref:ATP-binding protein n=1 Tax=Nonomuraea sp. NPDC047897 TaxID=3364346 RepID=UPI00371B83D2
MAESISRSIRDNLPADSRKIVGRRHEASAIKQLLSSSRLVTLTGPGGVGKTRLALYVAAGLRRSFADGVWVVRLAHLKDKALLVRAVAGALGVRDDAYRSSLDTLIEHLRGNRMLLVLDNCEHLVGECAGFADALLSVAPDVHILATSRESLGVQDEALFIVPPLSVPADEQAAAGDLQLYEAPALFLERARKVCPDAAAEDAAAVARLCRLLDGIPLAIELAAVWLRTLSVDQIIDRLDDRLHFLRQGYRTVLPRHQTLRATVGWSFNLCSPAERTLWARLSVFADGFDVNAAEEVCSGDPLAREDILALLASLIDKSVVSSDNSGSRARYRMLELLRQFGDEQLSESGQQAALRRRHLAYYRDLAARTKAGWFSPLQAEYYTGMVSEMPNFRLALDFCLDDPACTEAGMQIVNDLYGYWVFFGGLSEARYWLERAIGRGQGPEPVRFEALATEGLFALMQGDLDAATALVDQCRVLSQNWRTPASQATVGFLSGRLALLRGDYRSAVEQLEDALVWYEHNGGPTRSRAVETPFLPTFYLALAASFHGDPRAGAFAARCRAMAEDAGAPGEISMGMWVTGIERWCSGDAGAAAQLFEAGLRQSTGYRYSLAWSIECLGWATAERGSPERAAGLLGAAHMVRRDLDLSLAGFRAYADAHQRCESALRARLGDPAYEDAHQRGANLDIDEVVAFALGNHAPSGRSAPAGSRPPVTDEAPTLTRREWQVAELIARGKRNKEIATQLVIAQRTAEAHVEHILDKLGFSSRSQIATWYADHHRQPSEP